MMMGTQAEYFLEKKDESFIAQLNKLPWVHFPDWLLNTLIAISYFLLAVAGLSLAFIHKSISPVWPATGFAIACFFIIGRSTWLGILIGAFLANYFLTPVGVLVATGISIGNTLESVVGVYLLKKFTKNRNPFNRPIDFFYFV